MEKICTRCGIRPALESEMRLNGNRKCRECRNAYLTEWRKRVPRRRWAAKRKVRDLLVAEHGGRCIRCGSDGGGRLHFHHRDAATKIGEVGRLANDAKALAKEEAKKCDLLCTDCHLLHHAIERLITGRTKRGTEVTLASNRQMEYKYAAKQRLHRCNKTV